MTGELHCICIVFSAIGELNRLSRLKIETDNNKTIIMSAQSVEYERNEPFAVYSVMAVFKMAVVIDNQGFPYCIIIFLDNCYHIVHIILNRFRVYKTTFHEYR